MLPKIVLTFFTFWINCSGDLKNFANSWPSASNFKGFSRSLEHFFLTKGQNNFQWLVSDDSWFQKLDHGVWKCLELMWIVSIQAFLNNNIQKKKVKCQILSFKTTIFWNRLFLLFLTVEPSINYCVKWTNEKNKNLWSHSFLKH